jgi:pilus assembly protein TadC
VTGLVELAMAAALMGAVWLGGRPDAARLRHRALRAPDRPGAPAATGAPRRVPVPALAVLLALALALLVGGLLGLALGAVAAVAVLKVLPGLEPRARRRRRIALVAQAPDVVDLLAACLASGATIEPAVRSVADAVDQPAADVLAQVGAQLRLGADPVTAWAPARAEPALAPLATAVGRALDSGAPLADSLPGLADDLRAQRRAALEVAARQVGVRLTAPLGLAFLPAFVLLGVVPVIGALVAGVLRSP